MDFSTPTTAEMYEDSSDLRNKNLKTLRHISDRVVSSYNREYSYVSSIRSGKRLLGDLRDACE